VNTIHNRHNKLRFGGVQTSFAPAVEPFLATLL